MAVLFPTQQGQFLRPDRQAELLQGFLNIQNAEGVKTGTLSKANLDTYTQKQFFAPDPNSNVAGYLKQNFNQIAALDGNATSISTNDLVQLRAGLPPVASPPPSPYPLPQPAPLPTPTPPYNGQPPREMLFLLVNLMQLMMSLLGQRR